MNPFWIIRRNGVGTIPGIREGNPHPSSWLQEGTRAFSIGAIRGKLSWVRDSEVTKTTDLMLYNRAMFRAIRPIKLSYSDFWDGNQSVPAECWPPGSGEKGKRDAIYIDLWLILIDDCHVRKPSVPSSGNGWFFGKVKLKELGTSFKGKRYDVHWCPLHHLWHMFAGNSHLHSQSCSVVLLSNGKNYLALITEWAINWIVRACISMKAHDKDSRWWPFKDDLWHDIDCFETWASGCT